MLAKCSIFLPKKENVLILGISSEFGTLFTGVPTFQTPTQKISPHIFFGSPEGYKTPPGYRFDGGFSFYWTSLGPPVGSQVLSFELVDRKHRNFCFFISPFENLLCVLSRCQGLFLFKHLCSEIVRIFLH